MNETSMLPQRKPRLATPWGRLVRAGVLTALALTLSLGPCGAPIADAADDKRQDNVFGTVDEGMSIGTNPQTGDNEMRIESPPPPPESEQGDHYGDQPIIIQPEITIKPKQ